MVLVGTSHVVQSYCLMPGNVQGLFGRLGDLGSIDKQYDAAASNATGALDNLVVDTTVHAQQCVEHLRKHDLGVATFLILEKQANLAREMDRRAQTPEGIPRLFDLVKCSRQELRPAFFYAFRHTLVASDIDQASRIGHGSQDSRCSRVVTMQACARCWAAEPAGVLHTVSDAVMHGTVGMRSVPHVRLLHECRGSLWLRTER